jgi:hypothetical protein
MPRSPLLFRAVSAAALLASLTGCAEDTVVAEGGPTGAASPASAPAADLTVTYDPGDASESTTFRLVCDDAGRPVDPADSRHPDPRTACEGLTGGDAAGGTKGTDDPFAPVPDDAVCTMQYGGPQTATVTGTYRGETVDTVFTLENGCEIARWQEAAALAGIGPDAAVVP